MTHRSKNALNGSAGNGNDLTSKSKPRGRRTRRNILAAGLVALLASCGFTPVYGPNGDAQDLRGSILVDAPDNRNEFTFVSRLEERLGRAQSAPYTLSYVLTTREDGVGITPAQETTRFNLFGTARYRVNLRGTDQVLTQGTVENFTGYSATSLIVSTQTVTRDAHERLMVILADQVTARLIATASDWQP